MRLFCEIKNGVLQEVDAVTQARIGKRVSRAKHERSADNLKRMLPFIEERLRHWDTMVCDEISGSNFSSITMLKEAHEVSGPRMLVEPAIVNSGFTEYARSNLGLGEVFPSQQYNPDFTYTLFHIGDRENFMNAAYIGDNAYESFSEAGILHEVSNFLQWTLLDYGHDFVHSATMAIGDKYKNSSKVAMAIVRDARNSRMVNGYEEFNLQLNQQIFLRARVEKSPWFLGLVDRLEKFGALMSKVESACTTEVAESFLQNAAFLISSYVPRKALLGSKPSEWANVLQTAEPEVPDPVFWLDDEPHTIAEVSVKIEQALLKDRAAQKVALERA